MHAFQNVQANTQDKKTKDIIYLLIDVIKTLF